MTTISCCIYTQRPRSGTRNPRLNCGTWGAYIRLLEMLRLAKVQRVAPRLCLEPGKTCCDIHTVQAVVLHRFEVLSRFARSLQHTIAAEVQDLKARAVLEARDRKVLAAVRRSLQTEAGTLPPPEREALNRALGSSRVLKTIYTMRQELTGLWERSTASKEQLAAQLEDWCQRAEASGIAALQEFSRQIRCYACL